MVALETQRSGALSARPTESANVAVLGESNDKLQQRGSNEVKEDDGEQNMLVETAPRALEAYNDVLQAMFAAIDR